MSSEKRPKLSHSVQEEERDEECMETPSTCKDTCTMHVIYLFLLFSAGIFHIFYFKIGSINEAGTNTFLNLSSLQRVNNKKGVYEINVSFGVHTK